MLLPYFVRNSDLNISAPCMSTFIKIFVDLRKLKVPAIKLIDSMAKPPFGLIRGTFGLMGDYDECLQVASIKRRPSQEPRRRILPWTVLHCGGHVSTQAPQSHAGLHGNGLVPTTEFGKLGN
ncbi:NRF domain-containing protein, partial [Caerostris extrusa]